MDLRSNLSKIIGEAPHYILEYACTLKIILLTTYYIVVK